MIDDAKVGRAVEAYRKLLKAEIRRDALDDELGSRLYQLSDEELLEYGQLTVAIDQAKDKAEQNADAAGWSSSTRRQVIANAINHAGRS